ncbi:RhoGAP domain-containing protein [Encephalitozoon hellem ATCC 50504]|uniref:RhoGAP domain-containing protein n=1 Tax=Encephalitozoon hellem (strain ATCC 50504) TaxID=907965 RepID=UPI000269DC3B|nr:RhoGAP domain-containing protein [Encephalitozoon hellem ATCC 50504]AFM98289.1 RhoGAP domain-containing protein [Encephalitozoon hellem ATCC 50504]|eukprot:XP_003887270.1 RhoGAP domain-containing protein [Encephalitozoon hellem ATCC 50504]
MERKSLGKPFERSLRTVNGLDDKDFEVYRSSFFDYYDDLIRKYFGTFEIFKLRQGRFARMFFSHEMLKLSSKYEWVVTRLSYGKEGELMVPRNFYILTETVLSLDCKVGGIFRVRNSITTIKECVETINMCVRRNLSYGEARRILVRDYNVIDLTTAFKEILREYSSTIIPESLIDTMFKIAKVESREDQIILCQMLFISMPKTNRHVLEAMIYFLYVIHDIATDKGKNHKDNMNMEGISTIMMPNLVIKPHNELDLEQVGVLVNFMKMFFGNFAAIIQLDPNIMEL